MLTSFSHAGYELRCFALKWNATRCVADDARALKIGGAECEYTEIDKNLCPVLSLKFHNLLTNIDGQGVKDNQQKVVRKWYPNNGLGSRELTFRLEVEPSSILSEMLKCQPH